MVDILKEVVKLLPEGVISEAGFEAANIVLYTKDKDFFLDNKGEVRKLVETFKKRVELRPDPSITMKPELAEIKIREILPKDAGVQDIVFDEKRSRVIIHAEKPGLAIGKQGALLKDVRKEVFWVPTIRRMPPIRSKIIEGIRGTMYQNSEYRKKFLDRTGHRIYDGWIRGKKSEWVRLTFLGGARQVGRSCIFLQTPESRILIDVGIDVTGTDSEQYPALDAPEFDLKQLDAIVLSHAHMDHAGLVPYLYKMGYTGPVYCTTPTRDIMALLQLDMVKIQHGEGREPLYTSEEVKQMVLHTICLEWEEVTDITPDVRLTFYNSGHILGSSMVHLNIGNGMHNIVYTGDLKYARTNLLEAAVTQFPRMETLIIESTYGARDNIMASPQESDAHFVELVERTVARGGKVLMPTLGSGRAQEIVVIIDRLVREGRLPKIPIYLDGMLWDITAIYTAYPEYLNRSVRKLIFHKDQNPFMSEIVKRVGSQKERQKIIEEEGPCIICATSGMLNGGPSVEYFKQMCENKKHTLAFSSYQGEQTLGRRIQNGEKEITFMSNGKPQTYTVQMEVDRVEVSAHADRRELMNFLAHVQPKPKKVFTMHGEISRCIDLASSYHKVYRVETMAPRVLDAIRLR
ncbi:MAG TPA: beta-CASP ribonuclease aCPSF1 [Candidatus Nanoarchaeia archaeon]|nr:beta-CASP ribonuclease aCPSF1 [Candidatus Nanoarchaeia archaeon]